MKKTALFCLLLMILGASISADTPFEGNTDLDFAQVEFVKLEQRAPNLWDISVTIRHADSGWDHYADLWIVVNPENESILGERVLAHPHVSEQPFTRSLLNVRIPESIRFIEIRGKCNLHGFEGKRVRIDLESESGPDYSIVK